MDQQYLSTPGMLARGAMIKLKDESFEVDQKLPFGHQSPFHWCSATRASDKRKVWLQLLFNQFDNGQVTEFRQAWDGCAKEATACCIAPTLVTFAVSHNIWAMGVFDPFRRDIPRSHRPNRVARDLFTALSKIHAAGHCIGGLHNESIGFEKTATFCDLTIAPLVQYADDRHLAPLKHQSFHVDPDVLDSRTPSSRGDILAVSGWLMSHYPELANNKELMAVRSGSKDAEQWDAATLATLINVEPPPPAVAVRPVLEEKEKLEVKELRTPIQSAPVLPDPPTGSFEEHQPVAHEDPLTGAPEDLFGASKLWDEDHPTRSFEQDSPATSADVAEDVPPPQQIPSSSRPTVAPSSPGPAPAYSQVQNDVPISVVAIRGIIVAAVIFLVSWILASRFVSGYVQSLLNDYQFEQLSPKGKEARREFEERLKRAGGLNQ